MLSFYWSILTVVFHDTDDKVKVISYFTQLKFFAFILCDT